jgi:drug/metabolite transporter (DMT)-like permease
VLNPIWVFIFLGERPTNWALIGGSIIIAAVVSHTIWGARKTKLKAALETLA